MNNKDITQLKKSILYFNNIDKEINESNTHLNKLRKKRNELKEYIIHEIKKNNLTGNFKLPETNIVFEQKEVNNTLNKKTLKLLLDNFFTEYDNVSTIEKRLGNSNKCYEYIMSNLGKKKIESLIKKK